MKMFPRLIPGAFVLLWATGFIGARYAMPWAEPFSFLALRFFLAFVLFVALALVTRARSVSPRDAVNAMIAGVLMQGIYLGGVFWAIHRGMPAGMSALIVGFQPLITAILAGLFLGERIHARHWLGLAIGFAGVVMVVLPSLGVQSGGVNAATLSACLLAVTGMSAGTIWQKRFVVGVDLMTGTAWQYFGGMISMAVASAALENQQMTFNGDFIFAMVWLVLVLSLGAIFLLMLMIREGEVAKVASLFYLVPAVTAVIAWILFGEALTPFQVAGMLVAGLGVALAVAQPVMRARASR